MAGLKFNIHIAATPNFDESNFINRIRQSIDSNECGLKTISVQHISDQPDLLGRTEKVYECKVETHRIGIPGVEPHKLIFGALLGDLQDDQTFEILGIPYEEMELFD